MEHQNLSGDASPDRETRNKIVCLNLKLVIKEAFWFRRRYPFLDVEDLIQEGNLGLMRAADTFESSLGFAFSTYATKCIRSYLFNYFRKHWTVHIPKKTKTEKSNHSCTEKTKKTISMEDLSREEGFNWDDIFGKDINRPLASDGEIDEENIRSVRQWLKESSPQTQRFFAMSFGLDGSRPLSNREIAETTGLTKSRVSQVVRGGLLKAIEDLAPSRATKDLPRRANGRTVRKITDRDAERMKQMSSMGMRQKDIAQRFGVAPSSVSETIRDVL